ncbi:hypothetical protein PVAND_017203 [Polypedilum vanderplanki]|uniref:BTB domain-containing protein n=1 Tax=Polypedilum vanderplanki TaxID=319348 RepID=A0A9J6BIE4_POLVA|nr:hypothetical protein PVAND_017203 [Polypedilum vanderplanki]
MSGIEIRCTLESYNAGVKCVISNQKILKGNIALDAINHWIYESLDKNKNKFNFLHFDNCDFEEFPENFQELFPNVTKLEVNGGNLLSIGYKHVGKWKNMTSFKITNCGLKYIYNYIFKDMKQLQEISFANNKLEEIGPNILDGFEYIDLVDFSGNTKINKFFKRQPMYQYNYSQYQYYGPSLNLSDNQLLTDLKNEIKINCFPHYVSQSEYNEMLNDLSMKNTKLEKEVSRLTELLNIVLANPNFKNFKVNIGKTSFNIHKTIFASRSPVFAEMLENNPEATELNLEDISEKTFKVVYDFAYKEKLPTANEDNREIYAAAKRLKIEKLAKVAAEYLMANVTVENSFDLLVLSNKFDHEELRKKAFENIQTKIFPERKLDQELAKQPERLKKLIEIKKTLEKEFTQV